MNTKFPTLVIDNFLDDPNGVRDFALTLPYKTGPNYPGLRSDVLKNISPKFANDVVERFLKVFYNFKGRRCMWNADVVFQKIGADCGEKGWIHRDPGTVTCVLYLSPDSDKKSGTIIYEPKNPVLADPNKNKDTKHLSYIEREPYRKENETQFEESIVLQNKFNRLVAFDSHLIHAATGLNIHPEQEDRLTMVIFLYEFVIEGESLPLIRMRNFN